MEINVRNQVPWKNILVGTLFITVIPRGTSGNIFDRELVARKKRVLLK
jgi:hypothetical protein